jgi:hypothetical protein
MSSKSITDVLRSLLDVPGIRSAVVVGRDGFVIEEAGDIKEFNPESLGASMAQATNAIERMGQELDIQNFRDMFVEYGGALIIGRPVGDALLAIVAPDASQLGSIRYMIKSHIEELASFL